MHLNTVNVKAVKYGLREGNRVESEHQNLILGFVFYSNNQISEFTSYSLDDFVLTFFEFNLDGWKMTGNRRNKA